jgi:AraC-like DNA-binding protein
MADADPEFRLMRFSSDELPPRERFDIWRDTMTRKLLRLAIDPLTERPFRAKAALRALPSLRVGFGTVGPAIHHRTRQIAAAENDDIALLVNLGGPFLIRRPDEDLPVGPGEACLVECCEIGAYVMADSGKHLCVRIERRVLGAFARHVDRALGRLIPADTEALKLLVTYARTLPSGENAFSPAASRAVVDHVGDLMALVVGAGGEAAALAASRGLAAGRLSAAKAHIRERSGLLELTAESVAAEQGISPRYLRQLFEGEAQSFTAYLLEQRLRQAHAMLTSPRFAAEPISRIAFGVGFGDLSYFNRVFRRRYERTPKEVRAEAARLWREGGAA